MNKIIFATGNKDKMKEIRMILSDLDVEILSMKEAGISVDIEENGTTFEENALIEILTLSGQQMMALRSDSKGHSAVHISGLKPGIYIVRVNSDTSKLVIGK